MNKPLGRNHEQPARHPGNRHKGAQTTDRNLDRESGPQSSQPEGVTKAGEPKKNSSEQNTEADEEAKGRTPGDHQLTKKPCDRESPSVERIRST